jgi:hypothetical protein
MTVRSVAVCLLMFVTAPAFADGPVPGAPNWTLVDSAPRDCWAETGAGAHFPMGDTMHIKVMRNNRGNLIVAGARPDWRNTGSLEFAMRIDAGPAQPMRGSGAMSLVLTEIEDPGLEQSLRDATRLVWQMPWGNFTASVSGLGTAYEAVADCKRQKNAME